MLSVYSHSGEFYLYSFQPLDLSVSVFGLFALAFRFICTGCLVFYFIFFVHPGFEGGKGFIVQ